MRTMRIPIAAAALFLIAAACGDDDGATTTQPDAGGSVATTVGSAGGAGNGSITFAISGDYETSGEFPFVSAASVFSGGNWSATFAEDGNDAIIALNLTPEGLVVNYGDSQVWATGIEGGAVPENCRSFVTQSDSSGFVGSFECTGVVGVMSQTGTQITVDFSGEFSAHP